MSKIVVIGIDGLDPFLLRKWEKTLPNIHKLCDDNSNLACRQTGIAIESTFPPDSICAWTSIFTGQGPAEHGLIESIDYLSNKKSVTDEDRSIYFKGKTFWDIAGNKGGNVCVINPFIAYPAWEVNGMMVSGPVFEGGNITAYPESLLAKYDFPPLGGIVEFPQKKELNGFINRSKNMTEQLADVSLKIYKDYNPDLFFVTFLTLDRIKHFLWRFTDKEDIFYPGRNAFEDTIKDFYLIFDNIIGKFIDSLSNDASLLIISDHGHRRRCTNLLNLNEILRENGYLATYDRGAKGILNKLIEKAKVFMIATMAQYGFEDWIYKVAKLIPNRKALKKSTYLINKETSSVTLSNLCGANPYGGFDINANTKEEYEKLRDNIINELMKLNETFGKDIIKWVKKREQVYSGMHEKSLPDILFELDEEYGVGMNLFTPPITTNYTHKKISGGHKKEAVLLLYSNNDKVKNIRPPTSVVGLKDYILKIIAE